MLTLISSFFHTQQNSGQTTASGYAASSLASQPVNAMAANKKSFYGNTKTTRPHGR
jgi:hypothetical protein